MNIKHDNPEKLEERLKSWAKIGLINNTKLTPTQIYARFVDQTESNEMDKPSAKLSGTSFRLNGGDSSTEGAEATTEEVSNY